jgi:hypothetical protein
MQFAYLPGKIRNRKGRKRFDIPGVANGHKIIANFWKEDDK